MGFFDLFQQADIDQGVKEYLATPGAVLLDVRTSEEYRDGHIPGSKNVPLQALGYRNVNNIGGIAAYAGKVER